MNRNWVMYARLHARVLQRSLQRIPRVRLHDVEMIDVFAVRHLARQHQTALPQKLSVSRSMFAAKPVPPVQVLELNIEHGSLYAFEPEVVADDLVMILAH